VLGRVDVRWSSGGAARPRGTARQPGTVSWRVRLQTVQAASRRAGLYFKNSAVSKLSPLTPVFTFHRKQFETLTVSLLKHLFSPHNTSLGNHITNKTPTKQNKARGGGVPSPQTAQAQS